MLSANSELIEEYENIIEKLENIVEEYERIIEGARDILFDMECESLCEEEIGLSSVHWHLTDVLSDINMANIDLEFLLDDINDLTE